MPLRFARMFVTSTRSFVTSVSGNLDRNAECMNSDTQSAHHWRWTCGASPPDLPQLLNHEWLESNGLGGFASATVSGANTRRYHAVLIAAMQPPAGRVALVAR